MKNKIYLFFLLIFLGFPHFGQAYESIDYTRDFEFVASLDSSTTSYSGSFSFSSNPDGRLRAGSYFVHQYHMRYYDSFDSFIQYMIHIDDVIGNNDTSNGWTNLNPNPQTPYCMVNSHTNNSVSASNWVYRVYVSNSRTIFAPNSSPECGYTVTGTPRKGIIAFAGDQSSVFAITENRALTRSYDNGGGAYEEISLWGADPVPGSLVTGTSSAQIFGVNEDGKVFHTWKSSGNYTFAITVSSLTNVVPGSLAVADNGSVFGIKENGDLIRVYYNSGWTYEVISHWGADLVPGSLINGTSSSHVFGVNEDGKMIHTWLSSGNYTFAITDTSLSGLVPGSLAMSGDNSSVFGINEDGKLVRVYYNGGWTHEIVTHGGTSLEPDSLITGTSSAQVFGVDANGTVFHTWKSGTTFQYTNTVSSLTGVVPRSLALGSDGSVFALKNNGDLIRIYYDSGWTYDTISYTGADIVSGSLVTGTGSVYVYGVNEDGDMIQVVNDNGTVTFEITRDS